jgi:hypothetical protein
MLEVIVRNAKNAEKQPQFIMNVAQAKKMDESPIYPKARIIGTLD